MISELHINMREGGATTVYSLSGRLDYSTAVKLRKVIRECLKKPASEVVIDFGQLEYLDSMAMGALLVIREQLQSEGKTLVLSNCKGFILEALHLANFHKLFQMNA